MQALPAWSHAPIRWTLRLGLLGAILFSAIAFYYWMLACSFDLGEVERLPAATIVYDRNMRELDVGGVAGRRLVTRADLPEFLVKALKAREDLRFDEHSGIDVRGLLRATLRNIKDREFTQGASTLSMQLSRNTFAIRQKSIHRKLLEIVLTLRVESRYSKDEILTHYLNRIYFGAGCHGIDQAARTYFGRPTRDLNEAEAAMVIGIIRGPHIFSPFRDLDAAKEQESQVLSRMVTAGSIDAAERERILAMPVRLVSDDERETKRSYAMQAVQRELARILDDEDIRLGGLKVFTTLDAKWQEHMEQELARAVEKLEAEKGYPHTTLAGHQAGQPVDYVQFCAVTLETKTGSILSLIGGRNFDDSRFDRTRSRRDLGSAFEPFVAAAAAERGRLVLPGQPVLTGRQIGAGEVERIARRCGLSGPFLKTEDLFRGSVAATPMEMATGLATLGNQGKRPEPFLIREIQDAGGQKLFSRKADLSPALSARAGKEALSVLDGSGGTRTFTGATGSERDAWMMRLGPKGATAIWIGFDQPQVIAKEARLKSLLNEFVERLGD